MPAMRAYLDDFGSITIWMEKNFYGGKSDSFFLVAEDGYMKELVVKKLVEHDARVKYEMTCNLYTKTYRFCLMGANSCVCHNSDHAVRQKIYIPDGTLRTRGMASFHQGKSASCTVCILCGKKRPGCPYH